MLDSQQTVASLVLDHSECAEVFQRHRIDFCCRGDMTIEAAAASKGVALDALVGELSRAMSERRAGVADNLRMLPTSRLVEHIVSTHHAYLRKALPFVRALANKVSRVHGDHNPRLRELDAAVEELADALLIHLDEEESALFPALTANARDGATAAMLASMHDEHLAVASLLERIRAAAEDFATPDWACNSYRTLFSELRQVEGDTFKHVHIENHVLKPRFEVA